MDQVGRLVEWVFAVGMNLEVYSGQCHWRGGGVERALCGRPEDEPFIK